MVENSIPTDKEKAIDYVKDRFRDEGINLIIIAEKVIIVLDDDDDNHHGGYPER